jgi:PAS domain S-box-containing protein
MTLKSKRSIRRKLTGIIMLTSTTAVLMACLGFVVSDLASLRAALAGDLSTLAQVVGSNSSADLTFGDREGAREVLSALHAKPSIVAACIYTEQGEPFAQYEPNDSVSTPRTPPKDGFRDTGEHLELTYGIQLGRRHIGTLYIVSDSRDRNARLKQDATIAGLIVLVALFFAFVLSSRLQRRISVPIVELARVANLVSQRKDYTLRAHAGSNDGNEIDHLLTGFNSMLAEIEQRDDRLLDAKSAAEEAATISAQLARESALILNSATDGILGIGVDGNSTFLNPAASKILGRPLADFETKPFHDLAHHSHPDGTPWPRAECPLGQAIREGQPFALADSTFWRSDGSSFPVEFSATPMHAENGALLGTVMVFRDVTERRAIDRLKSEFVSTVSHELRTPLTSIRGALGLLSSGLLGPIAEKGQRMLEIAVGNTDRLVRLINDILDLERIGSGAVELILGAVDAHAVMKEASEGLQSMADEAGVRLVLEPASGSLWGDSDRIIQTLTNLIGNAVKFSPPHTTVTVSGAARGMQFVFCIADQGRGVPDEKRETIFERFSQVDASDSRDKGGSGLGLAICQSIVTAHGGTIWAEPNEPMGSRFQFTIPLTVSSTAAGPKTEPPHLTDVDFRARERANCAPSVLVVEDDLDLARVMIASLQRHGIGTSHAVNGSEAVLYCRRQEPALIVLDLILPDCDGFEIIRTLRESAVLARIPLIVYSALDVGTADQARLRLGPTEFLTKSRCSPAEFEGHVVRLLEAVSNPLKEPQHAA